MLNATREGRSLGCRLAGKLHDEGFRDVVNVGTSELMQHSVAEIGCGSPEAIGKVFGKIETRVHKQESGLLVAAG